MSGFWDAMEIGEQRRQKNVVVNSLKTANSHVVAARSERDIAIAQRNAALTLSRSLMEEIRIAIAAGDVSLLKGLDDPKSPVITKNYNEFIENEYASLGVRR